jgi:16S rRNA (uracil1498-N3)-methyltransferase
MTRVYFNNFQPNSQAPLPADAFAHAVRALRMQVEDTLTVFDGEGNEAPAAIAHIGKHDALIDIGDREHIPRASPLRITLAQGIAAADKMDWVIQKATELGVHAIQPVACERSVVKLSGEREAKRVEHWQRVAISACEQCGLNVLPQIESPLALSQAVKSFDPNIARWVLHPAGATPFAERVSNLAQPTNQVVLLIGPEGGFADHELTAAVAFGFEPVLIGPRVLRTETAGLAAIAALQATRGDW